MITPLLVLIWCCTVSKQQIWSIKFACYANFGRLLVHGCYFDGQTIIYTYLLAGILRLSHGKPTLYSSIVFYTKRFCRRGHKMLSVYNCENTFLLIWESLLTLSRYTQYSYRVMATDMLFCSKKLTLVYHRLS